MSGGPFLVDPTGFTWGHGIAPPEAPTEEPSGACAWLLDLQIGGRVLRYSTRRVTVTDSRGRSYLYRAGLADFAAELDGEEEALGVQVTDRRVDWALLASRGENLERASGVLRHWEPGELLEEARIVLAGEVTEPEYGDPERPALFVATLRAGPEVDRAWPDPAARVDSATFDRDISVTSTTYDEAAEGFIYPVIFGYPGEGDAEATNPVPCVPAPLVRLNPGAGLTDYLLLGLGSLGCVGGTVWVRNISADSGWLQENLNVVEDTDNLGRTISLVEVPDGTGVTAALGHQYYVGFSRAAGKGGGSLVPGGSRPMETLADVAEFVGRNSGRAFDLEAQEAERGRLDRYRIDGYISGGAPLVPWFEQDLLPLFPLTRARTAHGMYWRFVNWWAVETDAVAHLDADAGHVTRASSIRTPLDQVFNHFSIEFQIATGRAGARRTLTDEAQKVLPWFERPGTPGDDRILGSPVCALSQSRFGIREAKPIRTQFLWSESTALSVLQYHAARDAFPRRPVSYRGRGAQLRRLERGQVVTVTDSAVYLDRAVALVNSVRLSGRDEAVVSLSVLDPRRLG